jgi:hypothetical protein
MKTCLHCKTDLPLDSFNNNSKAKDGKQAYCRECQRKRGKQWRQGKTSELSAKRMEWKKKHRDRDNATNAKWRQAHPESVWCYHQRLRRKAVEKISPEVKCIRCGCDKFECLEINHKNGGGAKERKAAKGNNQSLYLDVIHDRRPTDDLEITCKPCNSIHYLELLYGKLPYQISWNDHE